MTLQFLMMMRWLDRKCARLNAGLAAVAFALGIVTGVTATVRLAESAAALALEAPPPLSTDAPILSAPGFW